MNVLVKGVLGLVAVLLTAATFWAYKPTTSVQRGYPGVGMDHVEENAVFPIRAEANKVPFVLPPAAPDDRKAVDVNKNLQVLGHLSPGDVTRTMTAITLWVAPKEGCAYCHAPKRDAAGNLVRDKDGFVVADEERLDSDEVYAKVVSRRMLAMVWGINSGWKSHVKDTGVTCWTCHRGNPVPQYVWYDRPPAQASLLGDRAGQNAPSLVAGLTSLPDDPFRPYLLENGSVRVISTMALPLDNTYSIKQAEWTYALMMNISASLGVNCTYCHNSRSMADWSVSPLAREVAWHGIRMVRDLNQNHLAPLVDILPKERLGSMGDAPKANCATCHQGVYKPLLGVSMLKDYPVLAEAKPQPPKSPPPEEIPAEVPAEGAPPAEPAPQ